MKSIILGGFLGSGKTTLLLQLVPFLAQNSAGFEYPVVVLENEISTTDVDSKILRDRGIEVRTLAAGCICCSSSASLRDTLREIHRRYEPAYLVIEATGMAYPDSIADILRESGEQDVTIVALADAKRWDKVIRAMPQFLESQLCQATMIFLNKIDLIAPEKVNSIRTAILEMVPDAVVECVCVKDGISSEHFLPLV